MNCREMAEFLLDYDSGELPEEVRVTFDEHLKRCPECVCYLKNYAFTVRACREAGTVRDLPPLPEELIKAILASRPQGH
jgi:predicted anti-sigma-YlaC factor YlaD